MPLQLDINIDTNSKKFVEFIISRDSQFDVPATAPAGFALADSLEPNRGVPAAITVAIPPITIGERRKYVVYEQTTFITEFDIVVPIQVNLAIVVVANLYISDAAVPDPAVKQQMKSLFRGYPGVGDPMDYLIQAGGGNIRSSWFHVLPSYSLTRERETVIDSEVKAIEAMYNSNTGMKLSEELGGLNISLSSRFHLSLLMPDTEEEHPFPREYPFVPKPVDPVRQQVGKPKEEQKDDIFNEVVEKFGPMADCHLVRNSQVDKDVAVLFSYPEFKITWEPVSIEIGCFTVIISIPYLWIRFSEMTLFAVVFHTDAQHILDFVFDAIKTCAITAALTGAVLGIVTSNFAVALAVFKGKFYDCMMSKPSVVVGCLFPELAIYGVVPPGQDWKKLI